MNRHVLGITILSSSLALAVPQNQSTPRTLTVAEAQQLVENVPEIRRARDQYRRPEVSSPPMDSSANTLTFQARSMMTKGSASGLIGNYQVDRRTGRVVRDVGNKKEEVRSYLMQTLRECSIGESPTKHQTIQESRWLFAVGDRTREPT